MPSGWTDRQCQSVHSKIGTPQEFGKLLAEEYALWAGVVKAANLQFAVIWAALISSSMSFASA